MLCVHYKCVESSSFLVRDKANEKKFKFILADSLKRAASCQLLIGYKVHVTKNVKPEPNQMRGNYWIVHLFYVLCRFKTHHLNCSLPSGVYFSICCYPEHSHGSGQNSSYPPLHSSITFSLDVPSH